jgi:arylsulfatase A-like enzyme
VSGSIGSRRAFSRARHRGISTGARWTLAVALATALGGCSGPPTVFEPAVRLIDELSVPPRPGGRLSCEVADELRPALGCPEIMPIAAVKVDATAVDPFPYDAAVPAPFRNQGAVIEAVSRAVVGDKWQEAKPVFAPPGTATVRLGLPHPVRWRGGPPKAEPLDIRINGFALPPASRRFLTRPVEVPNDAVLGLGVGITASAIEAGAVGAEFVVEAVSDGKRQELLRTTVRPDELREGWVDHRVDLDDLAGKTVAFQFSTAPLADTPGFTLPVWGAPEILVQRERDPRRNLVLVSLDTVRADHVLTEAFGEALTPSLDALAGEGVTFEQVVAPYNSTTASHMTLFTGVYPALHRVNYPAFTLPQSIPTLAEILSRSGYQTAAVTENAMITAGAGFARGFDSYRENRSVLDAAGDVDATFGEGGRWLEQHKDERFFLFLHTYEAHAPYKPKGDTLEHLSPVTAEEQAHNRFARNRRQYAAEIRYTDEVFGKLIDDLERQDLLDHTIIVVTSDHGEEFGEHGSLGHSKTLYDEVLRVPLVIWAPGLVSEGRRIPEQISLVDVTPTLLDLLGVTAPPGLHGVSLRGLVSGEDQSLDEVRFAEGLNEETPRRRLIVARTKDYKWIQLADDPEPREVYDLRNDPGEKSPSKDPALIARGRELIARYRALEGAPKPAPSPDRPLDPATQRKLEALGYVD